MASRLLSVLVVLTLLAGVLAFSEPKGGPAALATPGGSISVDNTQANGSATGIVLDQSGWPSVHLALKNDHTFWLRWSIWARKPTSLGDPLPDNTWANPRFPYIPPGSEAEFTITFDPTFDSSVQFFLDAAQTEDGSMSAAVVTVLQRTVDTVLTAMGASKRFQDADAQALIDAVDQFTKLPNCVDAAESAISSDPVVALGFAPKFWSCLTDPKLATVVAAVAADYGLQVGVDTLKNVVFTPLKIAELTKEVVDTMAAIVSGSFAGTVVFESRIALSGPQGTPAVDATDIKHRAQAAIRQANTYRYQVFDLLNGRALDAIGEVNLQQQRAKYLSADGSYLGYLSGGIAYIREANGQWSSATSYLDFGPSELLVAFSSEPDSTAWTLIGDDTVDGKPAQIIESRRWAAQDGLYVHQLWIDKTTSLPLKRVVAPISGPPPTPTARTPFKLEYVYSDFGANIDIELPAEISQPTPTPIPAEQAVATKTAVAASPTASAVAAAAALPETVAASDPQALLSLLLSSSFPDEELPPGFFSFEVRTTGPDEDILGRLGGVRAEGEGGRQSITFDVFATVEGAQNGYDWFLAFAQRQGLTVTLPTGFAYPAALLSGYSQGSPFADCLVRVGNVDIVGLSYLIASGGNLAQAEANACDLARAGIAHLQRIVTGTGGDGGSATAVTTTGYFELVLQPESAQGTPVEAAVLADLSDAIARRLSALGLDRSCVSISADGQIVVYLVAVSDPGQVVQILQRRALLEIIDTRGAYLAPGTRVRTSLEPNDPDAPTGPIYTTIISSDDLKDAYSTTNQLGQAVVGFDLKSGASSRFYDFTSSHVGQPMSIVIDKQVVSSPTIQSAISNQGIIEGIPASQVNDLVVQFKAGALPVPVEVTQVVSVSGSLPNQCSHA